MGSLKIPQGCCIERLDPSKHDRESFSCGIEELDVFLRQQANQDQKNAQSSTHVVCRDKAIVGYVTLLSAQIPLVDLPEPPRGVKKNGMLAATLIARMAVDQRNQKKRMGELILMHALKVSWQISRLSSCSVVVVDPKKAVEDFYLKYGFCRFPVKTSRLYLPIATVGKLLNEGSLEEEKAEDPK